MRKKAPRSIRMTRQRVQISIMTYIRDCPYFDASWGTKSGFTICTRDGQKWKVKVDRLEKRETAERQKS